MSGNRRPAPDIEFRRATDADVEAQHAVFVAAEGELLERHGFAWPAPPGLEAVGPTYRHLMRHDGERCFVAVAGGRIVGYTAALVRDRSWFLAALFIAPDHQGSGVGRRLLARALSGAPARRLTISDAIQPISNALYARHGLLPATPILAFRGRASVVAPSTLVASRPDPAALAMLDRAAYGFDRSVDHAFWGAQATPTVWRRSGEPVAYTYRWQTGLIGPIAGRDGASAADALQAELALQPEATVQIPGTSRNLVRAALNAGLWLAAPPGLLLVSDEVEPPRALAISSYGLY